MEAPAFGREVLLEKTATESAAQVQEFIDRTWLPVQKNVRKGFIWPSLRGQGIPRRHAEGRYRGVACLSQHAMRPVSLKGSLRRANDARP